MSTEKRAAVPVVLVVLSLTALACSVCTLGSRGVLPDVELPQPDELPDIGDESGEEPVPELITTPAPESAFETLAALNEANIPPRDRLDLAERLLGLSPEDITLPEPTSYEVGDKEVFWADNSDTDQVFEVTAVLEYATPHVYMWVEEGADFDPDAMAASAELFETVTYPTNQQYFGVESSPGIDGDVHLHILHTTVIGASVAGYYGSDSQYPESAVEFSNEREIFYINIANTQPGDGFYDSVLAHEHQHMIHWNVDRNEDSWVNEGLSELAVLLNDMETDGLEFSFVINPDLQLTDWPEGSGRRANYAAAYLYHVYFLDRFGDDTLRALVRNPQNGMDGVESTLAEEGITDPVSGQPITAEDLFADWAVANYVNDPSLGDGRYAYDLLPALLTADAADIKNRLPVEDAGTVNQFGTDYIELPAADSMRITFNGSRQARLLPTETVETDGDPATEDRFVWWSNRGDDSDMTLTTSFDLTGVSEATLEYDLWYLIENNWDYGYVEVSEDSGQTWTLFETPYTTTADPHGNSYGTGYTGVSADEPDADERGWLREAIDLSPYTGREILVRFEMITDDAVNQPGMVIDNVRVDAIGFYDDVEAGAGQWEAEGFVRHDNVLPQDYVVQVLTLGGTPTLERLVLDADNQGELLLQPGAGTREVVLVVSGVTPYTTEVASYEYTVTAE